MNYKDLPKDPMILLSFVNTKLRDDFPSLEAFCENFNVKPEDISEMCIRDRPEDISSELSKIDYEYDSSLNKFV